MGTWGTGVFDDDTASDIRSDFEAAIADGASVADATTAILRDYADALDDDDERMVVWLSLAALQAERGAVQPLVRQQALHIIETDEDIAWIDALQQGRESDIADLQARRDVLNLLRAQLTSTGT